MWREHQIRQAEGNESVTIFTHANYIKFMLFCSIQESSKAKMKWAIGAYERWHALRSQIHSARYTATWTRNNRPIPPIHESAAMEPDLKWDVCDFIVEI